MRTTAIMNLKGGTAKTVTAINAAAIMAEDYGLRVLLVDADSQANLTEFISRAPEDGIRVGGFADLLRGLKPFPMPTKVKNVRLLPGDETLMALDVTAAGSGAADPMALAEWLKAHEEDYDRVLIDCPPAFSAGAMAALIAADDVVIPMKLDAFGIRGMANLIEQIRNMKAVNPDLELAGVLPTMVYPGDQQREALEQLTGKLTAAGIRTFHRIRRSPSVDGSTFSQAPLVQHSPKCGACRDYRIFVRDLEGMEV